MAVSSTTGGLKTGVCLSTDRPDNPFDGQVIYETDTNRTLVYDNSAWVVIHDPSLMSYSGTGVTVTADAATIGGENVTPYTGRRNLLFNGAMQVAQRGTSTAGITGGGYYTADRWASHLVSAGTWTQTVENDAPTGSGFGKSVKLLCTTADAVPVAGAILAFNQGLEGQDLQRVAKGTAAAQQLTLSFWVKSNVTGTYIANFADVDNNRRVSLAYTINTSATWEKKTIVFPADATGVFDNDNAASLFLQMYLVAGSNYTSGTLATSWESTVDANTGVGQTNLAAAVNNYWQITGVQLELGDKATPFEHRSYGEELSLCTRYYLVIGERGADFKMGRSTQSTYRMIGTTFAPMRAVPTGTIYFDRDNGSELSAGATQKSITSAFYDAGGSGSYTDTHALILDAEL